MCLVQRSFSSTIPMSNYIISLIRSQVVLYCSPVWRPYLIKNIKNLEQLQSRATKYMLSDYISDYKTRLIHLRLLPLMYIFEISDILFFIKNFKHPTNSFNINTYVLFTVGNARSCGLQLRSSATSTNKECHFYFNRISRLWISLSIIDLNLPMNHIERKIKSYFWQHFVTNFNPENIHKLHYLVLVTHAFIIPQAIITTFNINITYI